MRPFRLIGLVVLPGASLEGRMSQNSAVITNRWTLREQLPKICNRLFHEIGSQQLEATYQECLAMDLLEAGVNKVHTEVKLPVTYKGRVVGNRRADMLLELSSGERAILELKALEGQLWLRHLAQLEYYMHYAKIDDGYLINFPHDDIFPIVSSDQSKFKYERLAGYLNKTQHLLNNHSRLHLRNTPGQREVEIIHIIRQKEQVKLVDENVPRIDRLVLEDEMSEIVEALCMKFLESLMIKRA